MSVPSARWLSLLLSAQGPTVSIYLSIAPVVSSPPLRSGRHPPSPPRQAPLPCPSAPAAISPLCGKHSRPLTTGRHPPTKSHGRKSECQTDQLVSLFWGGGGGGMDLFRTMLLEKLKLHLTRQVFLIPVSYHIIQLMMATFIG
jgi:hypothetical protein